MKNILVGAKKKLSFAIGKSRYPCLDLRPKNPDLIEAYYRSRGKPCIVNVDLHRCRWFGASGLSYSRDSLHPYIRTLLDYEAGKCTQYEGSYLERYWNLWQPKNLAEYYGLDLKKCNPLLCRILPHHNIFPWSGEKIIDYIRNEGWLQQQSVISTLLENGCTPARSCGPQADWFGKERFNRLTSIYRSIKHTGYTVPYGKKHIIGACLLREEDTRVLISNGQHRASSLVVLNYTRVPVVLFTPNQRGGPAMIRRKDAQYWPLVREGIFSVNEAASIFDRIFDGIGTGPLMGNESVEVLLGESFKQ